MKNNLLLAALAAYQAMSDAWEKAKGKYESDNK